MGATAVQIYQTLLPVMVLIATGAQYMGSAVVNFSQTFLSVNLRNVVWNMLERHAE